MEIDAMAVRNIEETLHVLTVTLGDIAEYLTVTLGDIAEYLRQVPDRTEYTYLVSTTPPGEGRDILYRIDNDTGWVYIYNWTANEWEQR